MLVLELFVGLMAQLCVQAIVHTNVFIVLYMELQTLQEAIQMEIKAELSLILK
jgi:hypothetical protein